MKLPPRTARLFATGVGFGMGAAQAVDGLWRHDLGNVASGLALLFVIAVLGERPWVRPKEDADAAQPRAAGDAPRGPSRP